MRADVRTRETNVGNLLADSFVETAQNRAAEFGVTLAGPLVGLQNGGGIRNDSLIPAGPITLLDTFDIAPFSNFVSVIEDVAPADLLAAVEHGLEAVPDPEGFFAQWSGLVVTYDASQAPGDRVVSLTVNGTPYVVGGELQGGLQPVDLATIDFLATGNDGYDMFEPYSFTQLGTSYQQSLANILATADLSADSVEYQPRETRPCAPASSRSSQAAAERKNVAHPFRSGTETGVLHVWADRQKCVCRSLAASAGLASASLGVCRSLAASAGHDVRTARRRSLIPRISGGGPACAACRRGWSRTARRRCRCRTT